MRSQLEEFWFRASAWFLFRAHPSCCWTGCYHLKTYPFCRQAEYGRPDVVQPPFASRPYNDVFRTGTCKRGDHAECDSFICGCFCHD